MAEYKGKLLGGLFTKAKNVLLGNGDDVESSIGDINTTLSKIGSEIKKINISGTTGTGQGAGNLVVYKSAYPGVKCLIPIGISGAQYRAQLTSETGTYWVISVNNAITGAWADNVAVTVLTVAVMS